MDLIFEWMGLAGTKESITVQPSIVDASDVWSVCFGTAESIRRMNKTNGLRLGDWSGPVTIFSLVCPHP
jgi:hypothetical protein